MADPALRPSDAIVLVVDDEDLVRRLMTRTLTDAGYEVVEARTGDEAVTLLAASLGRIQLVVSDIVMPGMTGLDLAGIIAERWPTVPMLLVSGQIQPPPEFRGCFLPKPFTPDSLVAVAVSLLPGS